MGCRHIRELYQAPIETEVTFKPSFLLVSSGNSRDQLGKKVESLWGTFSSSWETADDWFRPRKFAESR